MTRTELIAEAKQTQINLAGISSAGILCGHMADMLEADAVAARLALDAFLNHSEARCIAAITALKEALK